MVKALSNCYFILTDSGGLQEEAPSFGKPVLLLRENSERMEGVKSGNVKIIGTNSEKIFNESNRLIKNKAAYKKMSSPSNPYGDGLASKRITEICKKFFGLN